MLCNCNNYIVTAFVHRNYSFLRTTWLEVCYCMFSLSKILLKQLWNNTKTLLISCYWVTTFNKKGTTHFCGKTKCCEVIHFQFHYCLLNILCCLYYRPRFFYNSVKFLSMFIIFIKCFTNTVIDQIGL